MKLKDNLVYTDGSKDRFPWEWKCSLEELLKFKTWVDLTGVDVYWGDWLNEDRENRKALLEGGFPLSISEHSLLLEYIKCMEE